MAAIVLIRGGGDLASGVAVRLHRAGLAVVITELARPLVVRRSVAFAEAVFAGQARVEEVTGRLAAHPQAVMDILAQGEVAVLVDPTAQSRLALLPLVLVDGRMTKRAPELAHAAAELVIGLGPGFIAGENCHAVVETQRGHRLGCVYWAGAAQPDSGIPEQVANHSTDRILRAPAAGRLEALSEIGEHVEAGQIVARVAGIPVPAPIRGVLRGLVYPGLEVWPGLKIGDIDPRDDPAYCHLVSDKSLAVAGGVLEAILSRPALRAYLWDCP
jgi:xanthine dehydrogenase accessory factor